MNVVWKSVIVGKAPCQMKYLGSSSIDGGTKAGKEEEKQKVELRKK